MSEVSPAPAASALPPRRIVAWIAGAGLSLAGLALLAAVPHAAGTTWLKVGTLTRGVKPGWLLVLTVVWLAGLVVHSLVLTSSLPGLTSRRAVSLNLAGSAVANAVPMGGAVSLGVTTAMIRSWGFKPAATGAYLTVSTVWNVLARLLAGLLGLAWVFIALPHAGGLASGIPALVLSTGALVLVAVVLASERGAVRLAAVGGALFAAVLHRVRPSAPVVDRRVPFGLAVIRLRRQVLTLMRTSWARLTAGMIGYLGLLALLLLLCLRSIGDPSSLVLAAAAVGVERLVTAIPITPGGAGVGEVALVAVLTAGGVDPLVAVTAALVYRVFTFFLEIPVGLAVTAGWSVARRRRRRATVAASTP
jgi:uncharacterized membrane protein YbhN (UPF0104 family)